MAKASFLCRKSLFMVSLLLLNLFACKSPSDVKLTKPERILTLQLKENGMIQLVADNKSNQGSYDFITVAAGPLSLYLSARGNNHQVISKWIQKPDLNCVVFDMPLETRLFESEHRSLERPAIDNHIPHGLWLAIDQAGSINLATLQTSLSDIMPLHAQFEPQNIQTCTLKPIKLLPLRLQNQALPGPVQGMAYDPANTLYLAIMSRHQIFRLKEGKMESFAGTETAGYVDGPADQARFESPRALETDPAGNLYVLEANQHRVRKITPDGIVSTLAGDKQPGYKDGKGTEARFNNPFDLAINAQGEVFVSDTGNNRIRKISSDGTVTTVIGNGESGFSEGPALEARAGSPLGLDFAPDDTLYYIAEGRVFRTSWNIGNKE